MGCRQGASETQSGEKTMKAALKNPVPEYENPAIRPLTADDSKAYRALRSRILELGEGRYFNTSYTRESQLLTKEQWREWCTETKEHCIIGLFIGKELVGVMMVTMLGPSEDLTAEWEATWLEPKYRGWGLARPAYEQVEQWTKEHGYKHAVVFIRDDNTRSRAIREKQGFSYVKTIHNEIWADGSRASEHVFVKKLSSDISEKTTPYMPATNYLGSTLKFLEAHA
jgi:RimJ/RimL family protein N-acetyltransferase